jgi:magnesium transporter
MAQFCEDGGLELEQLTLILGPGWLVTVQERHGDCLDPLRERLRSGAGLIRRMGPDFLAYAVVDGVIDGYFPIVEEIAAVLEELEEEVIRRPGRHTLARIHAVRRTLVALHRVLFRERDSLAQMMRAEDDGPFSPPVRIYLRDALDHSMQALDAIESYREITVGLMDVYLSSVSNRLNEVMKTLTVMGTIFLPLSFLVGVYGMNFEHMPELHWRYGYPILWALMLAIAGGLLLWFRRRGWLARDPADPTEEDEEN